MRILERRHAGMSALVTTWDKGDKALAMPD